MYIAFGDGGGQGDDDSGHTTGTGNGQDTNVLLGKILRINVNGDDFPSDTTKNYSSPAGNPFASSGGAKEVWAYGLRNPFRNSFDRATGDLWIGDVGQDAHEEIDFQAANKTTVSNYEWRLWEGFSRYGAAQNDPKPANAVDPVYDYAHGSGALQGNAVIGGYVYRGPDPSIQNTYFFADEVSSHFWSMNTSTHAVANIDSSLTPNAGSLSAPSSFGEDSVGNMYIVSYGTGAVFRLATAHIPGDYDYDGDVDNSDYNVWRMTEGLGSITAPADGSGNSVVDGADYVIWRKNFGKTLGSGSGSETTVPEAGAFLYLMQAASVWAIQSLFARRRPLTRMMRSLS
jgi:hypothetical protein